MKRVRLWVWPVVVLVVFFGTIRVAEAMGQFVSTGKVAVVADQLAPEDVKGWMTVDQVATGLGMSVAEVVGVIGPPPGATVTGQTPLNTLEGIVPGFDMTAFRDKLTARAGGATATAAPTASSPAPSGAPSSHVPSSVGTESDIKGMSTLQQVADDADIPVKQLIEALQLPADTDPRTNLRTLREDVPGFEIQTVRDYVASLGT